MDLFMERCHTLLTVAIVAQKVSNVIITQTVLRNCRILPNVVHVLYTSFAFSLFIANCVDFFTFLNKKKENHMTHDGALL